MKKTKSNSKYPKALKRKIAQEYLAGKFSYSVAAEEYGLANGSVVKEFVKWYRKNHYLESMENDEEPKKKNPESKKTKELTTKEAARIQELEKELAAVKLKVVGLEALIDTAEQEFQINIRKKSGTKRSK